MEELIKVSQNENGEQTVNARELHKFLEVKTDFKDWMPRMLEYGFEENIDFCSFLSESTGGRPSKDYILTLDCAKEISMIQRTDKGKEARQYFINCETKLKQILTPKQLALMVIKVEEEKEALLKLNNSLLPKAEYLDKVIASTSTFTATEIAKDLNMTAVRLNSLLVKLKVQYKIRNQYVLTSKYDGKNYAKIVTSTYTDPEGKEKTSHQLEWTEYGRAFIHSLINKDLSFNKTTVPENIILKVSTNYYQSSTK
jgi:anti-repressor protein